MNPPNSASGAKDLSPRQAGAKLGLSKETANRMYKAGHLKGYRTLGGHIRILPESVDKILEDRRAQAAR